MNLSLTKRTAKLFRETADRLDAGNSELSESEALDILSILVHRRMSKAMACDYLNLSRSRFDDLVREGKLPKGRKATGFKELCWYRDELDEYIKRLKR